MRKFTNLYISLFYSGYFKFYPGTFASIISIFILFFLIELIEINNVIFFISFTLLILISTYFIKKYSIYENSHDSSKIVIDEFLGIYLIFIFYDYIYIYNHAVTLIMIFIFFRFFDIFKIFPANIIDKKMTNSLGVILDDLVASIYTITVMYFINVYN
tara:strand:+ start:831 stop:1304 length:474 start_codon:yes stop_codon:yes gene_type:complete